MPKEIPWSAEYWNQRYLSGGCSGVGSRGKLAQYKASIVNAWITDLNLSSAVEFGCGDGVQLGLFEFADYLGFDPSEEAVRRCREMYKDHRGKRFELLRDYEGETADAALSIDVVYHLVEDDVFDAHLEMLFGAATKLVVVYSSNHESSRHHHYRHRAVCDAIAVRYPCWQLAAALPNLYPYDSTTGFGSLAEFYMYVPQCQLNSL